MFRTQSLDKLSSPDRLDQLLRVVRPQAWVVLVSTGLGLAWAVWWGFTGEVPVTAQGVAILVRPKMVVPVEATVDGRVDEVRYEQGQFVRPWYGAPAAAATAGSAAGTMPAERAAAGCEPAALDALQQDPPVPDGPLFVLVDPQLEGDLRNERERLRFVCERNAELRETERIYREHKRVRLEGGPDPETGAPVTGQLQEIDARIAEFRSLHQQVEEQTRQFEDETAGTRADDLRQAREARLSELEADLDEKLLTKEDEFRIKNQILQLEVDSQLFSLRKLDIEKSKSTLLDWIATLTMRRGDLLTELEQLKLDRSQKEHERATEVGDIRRRIDWLSEQRKQGYVPMPRHRCEQCEAEQQEQRGGGELVSLTTSRGEMVRTGDLLARVELWDPHVAFEAVAFLPVATGKKIRYDEDTALEVRISPTSVEKERHGSLTGRIKARPSEHPVTVDMAGHVLGGRELAGKLLGDGIYILMEVELDREPDSSRLLWTGRRPILDPTVGTTCEVRVTLEVIRPIDLLFEFFSD